MISKERLSQIAIQVAFETANKLGTFGMEDNEAIEFAHALLKAVQDESEVVAILDNCGEFVAADLAKDDAVKLIALPLVEGD